VSSKVSIAFSGMSSERSTDSSHPSSRSSALVIDALYNLLDRFDAVTSFVTRLLPELSPSLAAATCRLRAHLLELGLERCETIAKCRGIVTLIPG
jgi:hypothetical protein